MPATAPTTLDLALFPGLIQHHPEHRLLYCKPCTAVVFPQSLRRHLQGCHRLLRASRQLLLQHCQSLDLITHPKDLQLPPDHSLALQFLPVQKGYSCRQCRFLSCSRKTVRRHVNKAHGLALQACTDSYCLVRLQAWFPAPRALYWVVKTDAPASPVRALKAIRARAKDDKDEELYRLEQQEIQQLELLRQDHLA